MTIAPTGQEPGQDPDTAIAELQRANAALRQERDAALAQRSSEYDERLAHQAATIDVLKAMSASPGDLSSVIGSSFGSG